MYLTMVVVRTCRSKMSVKQGGEGNKETKLGDAGGFGFPGSEPLVEGSPVRVSPDCTVKDARGRE